MERITLEIFYKKESAKNWIKAGEIVFFQKEFTDKLKAGLASKNKDIEAYVRNLLFSYIPKDPNGETYEWRIKGLD